jgi:hypothetical protein
MSHIPATTRPASDAAPKRSVTMIVFGIISLAYSAMMLCAMGSGIVSVLFTPAGVSPFSRLVAEEPATRTFFIVNNAVSVLANAVLIGCGVGLLLGREWARRLGVVYGVYLVAMTLAAGVGSWLFMIQPLIEVSDMDEPQQAIGVYSSIAGGAFVGILAIAFGVTLAWFLSRPKVKAAAAAEQSSRAVEQQNSRSEHG